MISVGVSGAAGRMGSLVAETIAATDGLVLGHLFDPAGAGRTVAGGVVSASPDEMVASDVVVEFTHPDAVMENLRRWADMGLHAVVGTSGFDNDRVQAVVEIFADAPGNCLIVPNFSIGAVLMMRFAEAAAPHFMAAEIIELHHDRKADAPSGTSISTAQRIAAAGVSGARAVKSEELRRGALGADVDGVRVHSVRLPGLLAHQEVHLGNPGEQLTIRHDSTDRASFMPGVLLAVRGVGTLAGNVTVGLDSLLA